MTYPSANGAAVEHHEERIQRLETEYSEIYKEMARCTDQISFVSQQLVDIPIRIHEQLTPSLLQLKELTTSHNGQITQLSDSVKSLEGAAIRQKARWDWIKGVLSSIVMAGAGAAGVKIFEVFFK